MALRAVLPNAHITVSPVPAPRRSATTTTLLVGCLSRSNGCTTRNRTPSRSGVFLVDQTVPMTLPKNMSFRFQVSGLKFSRFQLETLNLKLSFREYFRRVADVARRGGNNRARANVNLLAFLNRAAHVVLANKLRSLASVR